MLGALSCALRLLAGSVAAAPVGAEPAIEAPSEELVFQVVRVEARGFDESELLAALRLRMPRLRVERHDGAGPSDTSYVYLQVARGDDGATTLRVITPDGRAFDRTLAVDPANALRVAASMAANLIFAAEQRTLAPDREHVPIPVAPAAEEPPLAVPVEERIEPPPPAEPPPRPAAAPSPAPAPVQRERWELAVETQGAAAIALGPPRYGRQLAGGGGGVGVGLRAPRGAALVLEVRGLGRRDEPLGLGRLRVGLGGGYVYRRRGFELPVIFALAVEPWWVVSSGGAPALFSDGAAAQRRPMFGAYLRVAPGVRVERPRGALRGLRVGPRLELGGEMLVYDGPVVAGLADGTGSPHFRLGGLELAVGVELALWFGAPARQNRPQRRRGSCGPVNASRSRRRRPGCSACRCCGRRRSPGGRA